MMQTIVGTLVVAIVFAPVIIASVLMTMDAHAQPFIWTRLEYDRTMAIKVIFR